MGLSNYVPNSRIAQPGVCTSTTRPATPFEGQVIFETDTDKVLVWNGSAWYPNWNLPWGIVATTSGGTSSKGYVTGLAAQSVTAGNTADVTSSSMTFDGVSGRLYRYQCAAYSSSTSASGLAVLLVTDGSNTTKWAGYSNITNSSGGSTAVASYVFTASGSTTVKLRWQAITGTCTIFASNSLGAITLEDIGPA